MAQKAQPHLLPYTTSEIFELLPNQIHIDRLKLNVRPWTTEHGSPKVRERRLNGLARSIEKKGQLHAVLVTRDGTLIDGVNRVDAITLVNDRRNVNCQALLRVKCRIVDETNLTNLRRIAIHANVHTTPQSPIDMMCNVAKEREECIKENPTWSKRQQTLFIAEIFAKDAQTIEDYEKLHAAGVHLQRLVGDGIMSLASALLVLRGTNNLEDQDKLVELSRIKQAENDTQEALEGSSKNRKEATRRLARINTDEMRIELPAVRQALREFQPTSKTPTPATRLERRELLTEIAKLAKDCSASGRHFISYLPEFASGAGNFEELRGRFLAIENNRGLD
jgi:ParB-like chromosome segregation protein Spo0J